MKNKHIKKFNESIENLDTDIKHIIVKTHYWLFKKINGNYYFIRTVTEGLDRALWFRGYVNKFGSISGIGGELSQEEQSNLESEFLSSRRKIVNQIRF